MASERMNTKLAYEILGVDENSTDEEIRRAYRLMLLKYHPDKNRNQSNCDHYFKVREAYEYLYGGVNMGDENGSEDRRHFDYDAILRRFLSSIISEDHVEIAVLVLSKLCGFVSGQFGIVSELAYPYLRKINRPMLKRIYNILVAYREALHICPELLEKIEEILRSPQNDEYIVLNPRIEDLFSEENVYTLRYGSPDEIYYVPLWHHDMTYDYQGRDLIVKCFPILPPNMRIDEYNNLYVELEYDIDELWGKEKIDVGICKDKTVSFCPSELRLRPGLQKIRLKNCGIDHIDTTNVLNNSCKQDIILLIFVWNNAS